MYAALTRPGLRPPGQDRLFLHLAVFALCAFLFFVLVRGCGSTAQAPEPRFELVPDHFPNSNIARSK